MGEDILANAQENVPVKTGALYNSLELIKNKGEIEVKSDLEYALYVELGTTKQSAQPYLRPAIDETMMESNKFSK